MTDSPDLLRAPETSTDYRRLVSERFDQQARDARTDFDLSSNGVRRIGEEVNKQLRGLNLPRAMERVIREIPKFPELIKVDSYVENGKLICNVSLETSPAIVSTITGVNKLTIRADGETIREDKTGKTSENSFMGSVFGVDGKKRFEILKKGSLTANPSHRFDFNFEISKVDLISMIDTATHHGQAIVKAIQELEI
jgi:hypothetical protein